MAGAWATPGFPVGGRSRRAKQAAPRPRRHRIPFPSRHLNARTRSEVYPAPIDFQLVQRNRVAQLLEEPLGDLLRLARQAANLAQDRLLLRREVLRNDDLDDDILIAAPAAPDVRHAAPGEAERLAILSTGRDGDLDQPFECRDLDPVAKGCLDHVDAQLVNRVLLVTRQVRMRLDAK